MSIRTSRAPCPPCPPRPLESRLVTVLRTGVARRTASVGTLAEEVDDALRNGTSLSTVSDAVRDDEAVVLAAVRRDPEELQFASERLRKDRDVAMAAVQSKGVIRADRPLQYVHASLLSDRALVVAAIAGDASMMQRTSEEEREYITSSSGKLGVSLRFADEALRDDPEIAMGYIGQLGGHVFCVLSKGLRSSVDLAHEALAADMGRAPMLDALMGEAKKNRNLVLHILLDAPFRERQVVEDNQQGIVGEYGKQPDELFFPDHAFLFAMMQEIIKRLEAAMIKHRDTLTFPSYKTYKEGDRRWAWDESCVNSSLLVKRYLLKLNISKKTYPVIPERQTEDIVGRVLRPGETAYIVYDRIYPLRAFKEVTWPTTEKFPIRYTWDMQDDDIQDRRRFPEELYQKSSSLLRYMKDSEVFVLAAMRTDDMIYRALDLDMRTRPNIATYAALQGYDLYKAVQLLRSLLLQATGEMEPSQFRRVIGYLRHAFGKTSRQVQDDSREETLKTVSATAIKIMEAYPNNQVTADLVEALLQIVDHPSGFMATRYAKHVREELPGMMSGDEDSEPSSKRRRTNAVAALGAALGEERVSRLGVEACVVWG